MNFKWKRKRALSLVVALALLFSSTGTAAAVEPVKLNAQSIENVDTDSEATSDMAEEESEEKGSELDSESEEETEGTESESEEETEGTESESEEEAEGTESESEKETEGTESESEEETEGTESESEWETEGTESESEGETEGTESESEEETEGTESESEEETEGTESESEEETEGTESESEEGAEGTESESEEGTEGTESESEEETEGTESESEEGTEGTESESEKVTEEDKEKLEEDDLIEDSNQESSAVLENSNVMMSVNLASDTHEHNWSLDWSYDGSYHWHECSVEDCSVTDNSEKDGYGEHSYNDDGICTECGYDAMDGIAVAAEGDVPTYQEAYDAMISLKEKYPEGMAWTNFEPYGKDGELGSAYTWNGGAVYGARSAVGCMAFAFILSDAAFNNLPARAIKRGNFTFEDVKVGDILRVEGNSHSVIILQKSTGGVTVAEGNFKKTVHWGRSMSAADVENADFMVTRYPNGYVPEDEPGADEIAQEGTAGKLSWSITNGGVLTISGSGTIPDYSSGSAPWSNYEYLTIVIEKGVTGIGNYAFCQSKAISVYIPDSVTVIGKEAFSESALIAVTIPGSVKTIGDNAFYGCENLTSATVSEGVEIIGNEAFRGCTALAYIDFPVSITSVGAGAFMSCKEMRRVRFMPGSDTVMMGDNLFSECWYLTSVTLPHKADRITAGMFASCSSLPELYIPASVTEIGENPFTSCRGLRNIYFGGSETKWNGMVTAALKGSLQSTNTKVNFNVAFDDPFATDPNDPGDFQPDMDQPCTNHVDADHDGKCDNCGEAISTDNPGTGDGNGEDKNDPDEDKNDPVNPDDGNGEDKDNPDEDKKDPSAPSDGDNPPSTGDSSGDSGSSSGSSGGSSGDSGSGSGSSGGSSGGSNSDSDSSGGSSGGSNSGSGSSGGSSGSSNGSSSSGSGSSSGSNGSSNISDRDNGSGGSRSFAVYSTTINKKSDGSSTMTKTLNDGTVTTMTNNYITGKADMTVKLSSWATNSAEQYGTVIALPVLPVEAVKDAAAASAITVHTEKDGLVKVAIPAISPTAGTVAVMVHADNTTEVLKNSVITEDSIVAFLPDGATIKIVDNSKNFLDVPAGAWFEDAAAFVSARELFYHETESAFAPDVPMTCAMMMTALARFDGAETDGGTTWYEKSMDWGAAHGISDGTDPGSNITCEQLVTMLWKYTGLSAANDTVPFYPDVNSINNVQKAMQWAVENGIVSGFEDGSLLPQGQVTHAQAAQIIMNFIKKNTLNSVQ